MIYKTSISICTRSFEDRDVLWGRETEKIEKEENKHREFDKKGVYKWDAHEAICYNKPFTKRNAFELKMTLDNSIHITISFIRREIADKCMPALP